MSKLRMAAVAVMASCAVMLVGAGTASAQEKPPALAKTVEITGTKGFKGTFTIDRFARRGGELVAIGTVKGTVRKGGKNRRVTRRNVAVPAAVEGVASPTAGAAQITPTPNACRILSLDLGPIDLNLLGLRVRTNEINLLIEAIPGGGLLGDLLCAVTNLLNPGGVLGPLTTALNDLVGALNGILGILESLPGAAAAGPR
jgi:hypothetical protein